jgi:hypothetical protein
MCNRMCNSANRNLLRTSEVDRLVGIQAVTGELGSIPPTKSSDDSIDLRSPTLGLGNGVGIFWWHGVLFSVLPLVRSQYSNYGIRDYSRVAVGRSPVFLFVARVEA